MAVYADREAFIPYRKADVIELCIEDGKLSPQDAQKFREFCDIVGAYYHFYFHKDLEELKNNFAPFDPDADTKMRVQPSKEECDRMNKKVLEGLEHILAKANYSKLTDEELQRALEEESLITLKMEVDFNDYDHWLLYHRGDKEETIELKKMMGLKKVPFTMEIFERVVLLLRFKDEEYFLKKYRGKKEKLEQQPFTPGKTYIYMYKNIPKADLEVLFPNVKISMNIKDKLMLAIPAMGAAIPMLLKILPQLLLIIGVIAFLCKWDWMAGKMGADPNTPIFSTKDSYVEKLKHKEIQLPPEFHKAFKKHGYKLTVEAKVHREQNQWVVKDKKLVFYIRHENGHLNVYSDTMTNLLPILVASLSVLVVLGSFAFKQFLKYKNKKIQFLKDVSDTLFFRNLVCNAGVFNALIDAAEDEECKEVFLAYYHLLTHPQPLTQEELDDLIENWLEEKFDTKIDFDVEKALEKMANLKGKVVAEGQREEDVAEIPLLVKDEQGHLKVQSIDDAKTIIDYVWDNIFQYNVILE